jgi:SAM-dependent methyltransferase
MIRKPTPEEIHEKVQRRYGEISCSITDRFRYPTGREGALTLGYDLSIVGRMARHVVESFCGVGNPFIPGAIHHGEVILDVGCGGGFDLLNAKYLTGPEGQVYGIDLVPEMVDKARRAIMSMELAHCDVVRAGSESIPFRDNTFDVIISNGALYLSPLKDQTFQEICRVLKPDGHFQFADVVLKDDLPEKVVSCFDGWSG